jgi:CheY-like chemotaxis protein
VGSSGSKCEHNTLADTLPTLPDEPNPGQIVEFADVMHYMENLVHPKSDRENRGILAALNSIKSEVANTDRNGCSCNEVLLVDDEAFNLLCATKLFEAFSIPTQKAFNGKEAIEMIESKRKCCDDCKLFNFIVMDCNMPVMNGYDTTIYLKRKIKSLELPDIKIVGCTAFVTTFDAQECYNCGMDDYVPKPLSKDKVNDMLKKWGR